MKTITAMFMVFALSGCATTMTQQEWRAVESLAPERADPKALVWEGMVNQPRGLR